MKKDELVNDWLKRAKSNLERAKAGRISEDILYEIYASMPSSA